MHLGGSKVLRLDLTLAHMVWMQLSWEDLKLPLPSESTIWKDLAEWDRLATSKLCYIQENWDSMDMKERRGGGRAGKIEHNT